MYKQLDSLIQKSNYIEDKIDLVLERQAIQQYHIRKIEKMLQKILKELEEL